jgi:putative membrane protein
MNMLAKLGNVMVGLVALLQVGISTIEIFFWKCPPVYGRLGHLFSADMAIKAAPIVANAGLYNGFIAAGLIWGLVASGKQFPVRIFFLGCVIVAGIFGALTLETGGPLALQTAPGMVALLLVWFGWSKRGSEGLEKQWQAER